MLWGQPSLILATAPRGGPILGPPLGVSTFLVHRCFALRFFAPLDPYYDADQQITCFEECDPLSLDTDAELPASSAPGRNAGPVRQARLGAQDAAVDVRPFLLLSDFALTTAV